MNRTILGIAILGLSLFSLQAQASGPIVEGRVVVSDSTTTTTTLVNPDDPAIPEEGDSQPAQVGSIEAFGIWDLLRMVLVLGLIAAAAYGALFFIKKNKKQILPETQLIRILGSQGLPGNRWLHLINVQKQVFLIGSADNAISLIAEIQDQESKDEIQMLASQETIEPKKGFAELLGGILGGISGSGNKADSSEGGKKPGSGKKASTNNDAFSFMQTQKKRLKDLP